MEVILRIPVEKSPLLPLLGVATLLLLSSPVHAAGPGSTSPSAAPASSGDATDRLALLSFKSLLTSDPSGALASSWNETFDLCRWRGVTCGGRRHPRRVTALDLGGLDLAGPLSPSLANLTFLSSLRLPGNRLHGRIPLEIGRLSRLQVLDLNSNSLEGEIPANLSRCSRLINVTLRGNGLDGEIPGELGSLPELRSLNLALNNLTGRIPPALGNLSSLTVLILSDNSLEGSIPSELGDIPTLTLFSVGRNNLRGKIPPSIFNLSSLQVFDGGYNELTGTLPPDIGHTLPRLRWFLMTWNSLEGHIPLSFSNASELEYLEMKYNMLTGPFPSNLGALQRLSWLMLGGNQLEGGEADGWSFLTSLINCSSLVQLDMGGNRLTGTLPKTVGNLSRLEGLATGAAQISGAIPQEIGNLVNLALLNMQRNLLTGTIPETVGKLQGLGKLTFAGNKLSGEIPSSIGNLTRLIKLSLNINQLKGSIPGSLASCQSLSTLDLSYNALTGAIPPGILSLPSLYFLDLSRNSLTGPLPSEVGHLTKLGILDVSSNSLGGEIPSSFGDCISLEYVFMGGNLFQGGLPESLLNLRALRRLDLSRNNLSGSIPSFLGRLQFLERLNLSFNDLDGEVPRGGVFDNLTAISVSGNKQLCGGNPVLSLPDCLLPLTTHKTTSRPWKVLVGVAIAAFVSISLVTIFLLFFFARRQTRRGSTQGSVGPSLGEQHVKISYMELLRATDVFSTENLIGVGSFGSVYKGILGHHDDQKIVAVKVLNLQEHGAAKSFVAECEALRSVRHRNLARIVTSCSSVDSKGDDFKALVFDFMPNGSLERWLHPTAAATDEPGEDGPSTRLSFLQRLDIAIDVAAALEYLHNHGQTPIVHCDLKPSNILLDGDMNAVVSDFGLARFLLQNDHTNLSTVLSSTAGVKGSIGYIPPEYGMSSRASTEGDAYSYGILLLEMFTGRRPTDDTFGGDDLISLRSYVEMAFPDQVTSIIDPCLLLPHHEEEEDEAAAAGRLEDCMVRVARIGLLCSNESPGDRMEMRDVTKDLHKIKDMYMYISGGGRPGLGTKKLNPTLFGR